MFDEVSNFQNIYDCKRFKELYKKLIFTKSELMV